MGPSEHTLMAWLKRLVAVAIVLAVALVVIGIGYADDESIALEAAKAGFQLVLVTVLGGVLTYVLKEIGETRQANAERADKDREERRRLNEYRMKVFSETIEAYNEVKTVRRTLRATVGMTPGIDGPLAPDLIDALGEQMAALNRAELSFEAIVREITAQPTVFSKTLAAAQEFETSTGFLKDVLNAWETGALRTAERDEDQTESVSALHAFLARRKQKRAGNFWLPFEAFEQAMREDLAAPLDR